MQTTKDWGITTLILVALAGFALALSGTMDAKEAENSLRQYCEMVAQWDKDAAQGIAPEQRTGWPPYDGRDKCNKEH